MTWRIFARSFRASAGINQCLRPHRPQNRAEIAPEVSPEAPLAESSANQQPQEPNEKDLLFHHQLFQSNSFFGTRGRSAFRGRFESRKCSANVLFAMLVFAMSCHLSDGFAEGLVIISTMSPLRSAVSIETICRLLAHETSYFRDRNGPHRQNRWGWRKSGDLGRPPAA